MGLGILDDNKLEHVPGTATVFDIDAPPGAEDSLTADLSTLKYDRSGPVPIILVPQPSDDPNDPLNWPLWRRDLYLLLLSILAVLASTLSPLLAADTLTVALYFNRTFTDVALLTGYHLLGVGVAGFLFVPSARVWGKRHAYLIGAICVIWGSAWGGATHNCGELQFDICKRKSNYRSLLWARIFQGVGLAPFEALVNATVGDLYFVHQRGLRMALTNLCLFGGAFLTPVIVGKVSHTIGWHWTFYLVAILTGVMLPLAILYLPETAYRRDASLNTDTATTITRPRSGAGQRPPTRTDQPNGQVGEAAEVEVKASDETEVKRDPENQDQPPQQRSKPTLYPFNGRKSDESFLNLLFRPLPLFFHPGILWACLIQGTLIGWTVMIGIVLAAIMLGPPLFFDEVKTGYMYVGPFIGAIVGFLLSGLVADWSAKVLTRRNGGVFEPEFRLVLVIMQLIFGCAGLYGFGIVSSNSYKYGSIPPTVFFGFEVCGMVIGAVASALYIVDAHRDIAIEAFTCCLVFKNLFSFGLTWHSYNYLVHSGIRRVFNAVATVQVVICLLTIPLYVFGKKNRSFWARHNIFFKISDTVADAPVKLYRKLVGDSRPVKS